MSLTVALSTPRLSPVEDSLYGRLEFGRDVLIADLYTLVTGISADKTEVTFRQQQQAVGKYISRINGKIAPLREVITPGKARRTYCLRKMRS
jgi:hypothetical protein